MGNHRTAHWAGIVCLAGATIQLVYGLLAVLFPYPEIVEARYEAIWAFVSVGMVAGIVGWLALDVARPRGIALVGGGLAILGHLLRAGVAVVLVVNPDATVEAAIVGTILLMFVGMAMVGVGTLRGRQLAGWAAWVPLLTVALGLVTATFYSVDRTVHFALLGLLWGPAWVLVGYVVLNRSRGPVPAAPTRRTAQLQQ